MGCQSRRKCFIGGVVVCFLLMFFVQPVEAAGTKKVSGTCEYDMAYELLEAVNKERRKQGAQDLEMDQDLLIAAMMRAAECTVCVTHERPNGTACFEACEKIYGENLAYGFETVSEVMEAWMKSSGHRKNMLNAEYASVGIGCFYVNGERYWSQCFGYAEADAVKEPSNCIVTYKIALTSGKETELVASESLSGNRVSQFRAVAAKNKLILSWDKQSEVDGYQLQVSAGKNFTNRQTFTIGKKTTKKTLTKYKGKKLESNKKYYVRIRSYNKITDSTGKTIKQYNGWSKLNKKTK